MARKLVMPHELAVRCGMKLADVESRMEQYAEPWRHLLYHACSETHVASFDEMQIPDEWECPQCQRIVYEEDCGWDKGKILECDRFGLPIGWNEM